MRQDLADKAVDAAFWAIAAPAEYRAPSASGGVPCKVVVVSPDEDLDVGQSRVTTRTMRLDVRGFDVPQPVKGGVFTLLDDAGAPAGSWRVLGDPQRKDSLRRIWTCVVEAA
ncbi:head-tail joining protein [Hansschlegelia zhihuaiae]|uniref:Uncharacterized protein n=1 Tax=Hansschlegelia zhihuaiae TaxID=405005 RepID=A0A4Q0MF75_9HYPH|nr:hypothetical protein [Hansschlegelia zhihuaiae]RXF72118.1 hypothetical protein EK403_15015 [Hansschlegelia zhihuaiae]